MEDAHLWELAQRITSTQDLLDLGLKVLKLPDYKVESALSSKKEVELAAHRTLQIWIRKQTNRYEAYRTLVTSLKSCGMHQLAAQLMEWVEKTRMTSDFLETRELVAMEMRSVVCVCLEGLAPVQWHHGIDPTLLPMKGIDQEDMNPHPSQCTKAYFLHLVLSHWINGAGSWPLAENLSSQVLPNDVLVLSMEALP